MGKRIVRLRDGTLDCWPTPDMRRRTKVDLARYRIVSNARAEVTAVHMRFDELEKEVERLERENKALQKQARRQRLRVNYIQKMLNRRGQVRMGGRSRKSRGRAKRSRR